jgi:OHCU decarboxylase
MTRDEFVQIFGGMYEHSPWAAREAWSPRLERPGSIIAAMKKAVDRADDDHKDDLIKAHPDLVGKLALSGELTEASSREQTGAGLDQCSEDELQRFTDFNARYRDKFGFPFIIAVKGMNRSDILGQFAIRLKNDKITERKTALREIHKIARLRIEAHFNE